MANQETKLSFSVDLKGAQSAQKVLDELNKKAIDNAKKQRDEATAVSDALAKTADDAKRAADAIVKSGEREDAEYKKRLKAARELAKERERAAKEAGKAQETAINKVRKLEEDQHKQNLKQAAASERSQERQRAREAAANEQAADKAVAVEQRAAEKLQAAQQKAQQAQAVTSSRQGAFGQGFLQGAMPGGLTRFIDRGPGAARQAAGIVAGDTVSSLASIPFTGMAGIAGATGALGSVLSAPLGNIFGNSGSALSRQRGQLGMMPYLGGYGSQGMAGTRGLALMSDAALEQRAQREGREAGSKHLSGAGGPDLLSAGPRSRGDTRAYLDYVRGSGSEEERVRSARNRLQAQREQDRNSTAGINELGALGQTYGGRSIPETQQFVTQMAMRAGGTGSDLARQGLVESALAANTKYGVSPDAAAAFGRAGRNGGLVGGEAGSAGFARLIGNAVRMGLTGSDLTRAVEESAQVLSNFERTGIPLAAGAINSAASGFRGMGLSASMAQQAGQGITSSIQQAGMNGPQDAFGVAMLQALGGSESYGGQLDAEREMRNPTGNTIQKIYGGLAKRVVNRGQGKIAHRQLMTLFQKLNVPFDDASVDKAQARLKAGDYSLTGGSSAPLTPEQLAESARGMTTGALRQDARQRNNQDDLGEQGIGTSQAATAAATAVSGLYAQALAPTLRSVATALTGLTLFLEGHGSKAAAAAQDGN